MRWLLVLGLIACLACVPPVQAKAPDCDQLLQLRSPSGGKRLIEPRDLIEINYIGSLNDFDPEPGFSVSPDGRSVAVLVRRADLATNDYCSGLFVVTRGAAPELVATYKGSVYWKNDRYWGTADFDAGPHKTVAPRWSHDGKYLAYLRPDEGRFQVWLADRESKASRRLTGADGDVTEFAFSADGTSLVFRTQPLGNQRAKIEEEGKSGWHFDERFFPVHGSRPHPVTTTDSGLLSVFLDGDPSTVVDAPDADLSGRAAGAEGSAVLRAGAEKGEDGVPRVSLTGKAGRLTCEADACIRPSETPWVADDGAVIFLKREGWARSGSALYRWTAGEAPRRIYSTDDLLINCGPFGRIALCGRETSTRPRYLDLIDTKAGKSVPLFDPNPALSGLRFARVERRHWRNEARIASFGDLIYPVNYSPGKRYPLVVVQYDSRGYLSGGTGDEYPVQLFAARGYFVLSIQRPDSPFYGRTDLTSLERQRLQLQGFAERKSILSSVEVEVKRLIAENLVDPLRIGITGLSDGSTTVQFAALHSNLFSAAAVSSCCWEPSMGWLYGPSLQASQQSIGWPKPGEGDAFWSEISFARRARDVSFPILIQAADSEYLAALESFTALRRAGKPVDLFIYPAEGHIKRQPVHRLALYRRNLAWFDFWLRGIENPGLVDEHELLFWRELKRARMPPAMDGG